MQEVASLLDDQDSEVVYEACVALASCGFDSGCMGKMGSLLKSDDALVRYGACAALGMMGAENYNVDIAQLLSDKCPEVQGAACVALGSLGDDRNVGVIAGKLQDPKCRQQALSAMLSMEVGAMSSYTEDICDCLLDSDLEIRYQVVTAGVAPLRDAILEGKGCMGKVVQCIHHEEGNFRITGANAAGFMGKKGEDRTDELLAMLQDTHTEPATTAMVVGGARRKLPVSWRKVNCAAAVALGMICQDGGKGNWDNICSEIAGMLEDEDWEVRLAALEALALCGKEAKDYATKVTHLFEDPKYQIKAKAAYCISKLGEEDVAGIVADLIDDKSPSVKEEALLALGSMETEGAEFLDQIFAKIYDTEPRVAAAAITALGMLNEKGRYYAAAIAQMLNGTQYVIIKTAALTALGNMQDHGAAFADMIAEFLEDNFPEVRAAAASSLGKMGKNGVEYTDSVMALCHDPSQGVREAAEKAAHALGARAR
jgi:HEAT repeat protein